MGWLNKLSTTCWYDRKDRDFAAIVMLANRNEAFSDLALCNLDAIVAARRESLLQPIRSALAKLFIKPRYWAAIEDTAKLLLREREIAGSDLIPRIKQILCPHFSREELDLLAKISPDPL